MSKDFSLSERLVACLGAVLLALPTAFVVWFAVNLDLALHFDAFLSSIWLWGTVAVFVVVALWNPHHFVNLMGTVWAAMERYARWF